HRAARGQGVEGEAHPTRAYRRVADVSYRTDPFGGPGDPGAADLVGASHAPALQQGALDGVPVGAFEVVVLRHGAQDAVIGAADGAVAGPQGNHGPFFVDALAEPLGDAALTGACRAHEDDQPVRRSFAVDDLVADFPQHLADVLASDERALPD